MEQQYTTNLTDIKDDYLLESTMKCVAKDYKFRALYVSEDNMCSISFYGMLNAEKVKDIFAQFNIEVNNPIYDKHYTYMYDIDECNENRECTLVLISNGVED